MKLPELDDKDIFFLFLLNLRIIYNLNNTIEKNDAMSESVLGLNINIYNNYCYIKLIYCLIINIILL